MKAPLTVKFTDKSIGKPTTWSWNFGDKTAMSKAQNPMHKYVTAGKYKVTLIVKNAKGISSKVTKTITLKVTRK
jgi:PKD repeat protein